MIRLPFGNSASSWPNHERGWVSRSTIEETMPPKARVARAR